MTNDMTPVAYPDPIVIGSDWDWKFLFVDDTEVDYFDWMVDDWELTIQLRDRTGQLLATLANFGSPDGTITPLTSGELALNLPGSVTADLPPTRVYINSTDPRIATWRNRGSLFFDLQAVNVTQDYTVTPLSGFVPVQKPVAA